MPAGKSEIGSRGEAPRPLDAQRAVLRDGSLSRRVSGYVLKQSVADELVFAIQGSAEGPSVRVPERGGKSGCPGAPAGCAGSRRAPPSNVMPVAGSGSAAVDREGQSTKEIASTLNVSIKTVEFHKTRIMKATRHSQHRRADQTCHIAIGLIAMTHQPTVPGSPP